MKNKSTLFAALGIGLLLPLSVSAEAPSQGSTHYSFGQRAYLMGDNQAAKAAFARVPGTDPNRQSALNYLRLIAMEEQRKDVATALTNRLRLLVLEKLSFKDVSLSTALDFLKQQAEKLSDGGLKLNFVLAVPPGYADSTKVSVDLADIPFLEALKYICKLSRTKFTIEKHGILIEPESARP